VTAFRFSPPEVNRANCDVVGVSGFADLERDEARVEFRFEAVNRFSHSRRSLIERGS
jgi:hypothetical protein